jgi:hypothetical protein
MFEGLKKSFNEFREKIDTNVKKGWNGLKDKMSQMRDRVGIFTEESLAEIQVVTAPVVNGVKEIATGAKDAYQAVEGNIFKRLGNVAKEGWNNMKEKFLTLKENVENKIKDLKARGASEGVMTFVHDAFNAVETLPLKINEKMERFQEKKLEVIANKINREVVTERLSNTYEHVNDRREYFMNKASEIWNKLAVMRAGRAKFAAASMTA